MSSILLCFLSIFFVYCDIVMSKEGDLMTAGEKIRYIRESKNITQAELAEILGMKSKSAVSRTESSGDKLTTKTIMRYAKALGVSPVDIISEDKPTPPAKIEVELARSNTNDLKRLRAYIDYLLTLERQDTNENNS